MFNINFFQKHISDYNSEILLISDCDIISNEDIASADVFVDPGDPDTTICHMAETELFARQDPSEEIWIWVAMEVDGETVETDGHRVCV